MITSLKNQMSLVACQRRMTH